MIQTLSDLPNFAERGAHLVFGTFGTGKTFSVSTLYTKCHLSPIWYFDLAGGDACWPMVREIVAAGGKDDDFVRFAYDTSVVKQQGNKYTEHSTGQKRYNDFIRDWNIMCDLVDPSTGTFRTTGSRRPPAVVVVDDATSYQETVMDFVIASVGKELGEAGHDSRTTWGLAMAKTKALCAGLAALPCVGVMLAHDKTTQNDITSDIRNDPAFTGQLATSIGGYFSSVLYSKVVNGKYVWDTKPIGLVKGAKVRGATGLPQVIEQDFSIILGMRKP